MDIQAPGTGNVMIEIDKLAVEEESKRKELNQLQSFLSLDIDYNVKYKSDNDAIQEQINKKNQLLLAATRNCDYASLTLDSTRSASVLLAITKKQIEKNEPTVDQQIERLNKMKENYKNTLAKYEENPIYRSIIKTGSEVENFADMITEKQNLIMKLETEREFV